jgi:hypothetical protein
MGVAMRAERKRVNAASLLRVPANGHGLLLVELPNRGKENPPLALRLYVIRSSFHF